MIFKAEYHNIKTPSLTYWRTVRGDSVNEADTNAKRLQRKGFRLVKLIQQLGKD